MATNTLTRPEPAGHDAADRPPARLWQLPLFLVGLGLFLFVYYVHPTRRGDTDDRRFDRSLAAIRALLTRPAVEADSTLNLAEAAYKDAKRFPQRAGEVTFLLGSAHARKAEAIFDQKGTVDQLRLTVAREHLSNARQHLEKATTLGVADADRPRLQYRLARVCFLLNEQPETIVKYLAPIVEKCDDPVEGYQMLIPTYLRLPQPDVKAALEASDKLRNVPSISEEAMAQARLQAGELHLRDAQPDAAHKVLERITSQAPAALQVQARALRVRSYLDQGKFDKAASLLVQAKSDRNEPAENLGRIYLDLGLCYFKQQQPDEAIREWEQCLKGGPGPEQRAAAYHLADLHLHGPGGPEKALESLAGALAGAPAPADWKDELVELTRLSELCERAIQATAKPQRDLALRWTQTYQKVALAGRAHQLRADLLAQAGREQWQAGTADAGVKEQALKVLREAAKTYAAAGAANPDTNARAELLWKAADLALLVQDSEPAIQWLTQMLKLVNVEGGSVERRAQGYYLMGETLRQMNSLQAAEEAYKECMKAPLGAFPYRARFQLALMYQKAGKTDDAEGQLRQNLQLIRGEGEKGDRWAKESSLYALGGLYFERKKYAEVARIHEEALEHFPANPEATRAHWQLAESYRKLAEDALARKGQASATEEGRQHLEREYYRWLKKAADEFEKLARFLVTPESQGHLTPEIRRQVPFTVAGCRFDLGQYDRALEIYAFLADYYKEPPKDEVRPEDKPQLLCLDALGGVVRCHAALGQREPLAKRLAEIRAQLAVLTDEAVRAQWEEWVTQAAKPVAPNDTRSMSPNQGQPMQPEPIQFQPGTLVPPQGAPGPERINPNAPLPPG